MMDAVTKLRQFHSTTPVWAKEDRAVLLASADTIEAQAERIRVLERLVIDAAYTLEKARIWNGMGWTYNPLHPIHYAPMRERLHNECDNIEAIRAALESIK